MKFVDSVKIHIRSGNGGSGCTSFRREKYVPMGGPDGGDGGKGGDIIFVGDNSKNTLLDLSFKQHQHAENGKNGGGSGKHGRNGKDLRIPVPLGTVARLSETGEVLQEVIEKKDYLVFSGGRGGRGNARFKSATNRNPDYHQPGESGTEVWVRLDLKLMADVGLVGLPNAGKSTLISKVSHARPRIADYPFTTFRPHLGTIKYSDNSFVIADIPGIIEGASDGHGLGIKFLKHISRTGILLFFLEAFSEISVQDQFLKLKKELGDFSEKLLEKEFYIVVTKIDLIDEETRFETLNTFNAKEFANVFGISSVTGEGVQKLLDHISRKIFI